MPFSFTDNCPVQLEEQSHTYFLTDNPSVTFTSCTNFIGEFFEKFDELAVATALSKKPQHMGKSIEHFLEEWKHARDFGTRVHLEIEQSIKHQSKSHNLSNQAQNALLWVQNFLPQTRYEILPEVLIYSEDLKLAGTIDLLIFDKKTQEYSLLDWKTNKRISKTAFNNKTGIHPQSQSIPDCNYIKYSLQLSLYRYILEKNYNLTVAKQGIVHLKPTHFENISCQYLQTEIEQILSTLAST